MQVILLNINKYDTVGVLTQKNNPSLLTPCSDYKLWATNQLLKAANLYHHRKVINPFEELNKLINNVNMDL